MSFTPTVLDVSFEGGSSLSRSDSKADMLLNHLKSPKKTLMHIDLTMPSCGKWRVTRSQKQCQDLHSALDKEFALLAPKPPPFPSSNFKDYINSLLKVPSIAICRHVQAFLSIPDETVRLGDTTGVIKEGTLKDKKADNWCIIKDRCLTLQERKNADKYIIALLLDGCKVEKGRDKQSNAFTLSAKGVRKSLTLSAANEKERDSWVEAIDKVNKIYETAKFKVNGKLDVTVVEGRSLAAKDFSFLGGKSDPYAIVSIEHQQSVTHIIQRTLNPEWNCEFAFDISQHNGILFVLLYDYDLLSRHDFMGQLVLPLTSIVPNKEIDLWLPVLPKKKNEKVKGEVRLKVRYEYTKEASPDEYIFGHPLEEIAKREAICVDGIPKFLLNALQFIENHAIEEEGIFRLSGAVDEIKRLRSDIDKGKEIDFSQFADNHDTVSGVIKLFLRELPNPVLTFEKYDTFVSIMNNGSEKASRVQEIANVVRTLPPAHLKLLKILLPFLKKVSTYSKTNMMTVSNLSIVFGPPLLRPKEDTFETMYNTVAINELAAILIGNSEEILAHADRSN